MPRKFDTPMSYSKTIDEIVIQEIRFNPVSNILRINYQGLKNGKTTEDDKTPVLNDRLVLNAADLQVLFDLAQAEILAGTPFFDALAEVAYDKIMADL